MKSRKYSLDWTLLVSAGIFFVLGKFIAPRYEELLLRSGVAEEVTPISKYSLIGSGILILCLLGRWIFRWKKRKKSSSSQLP